MNDILPSDAEVAGQFVGWVFLGFALLVALGLATFLLLIVRSVLGWFGIGKKGGRNG